MYEYVVEYLQQYREHSTAKHSAITPAQSSKPSTCRSSTYQKMYIHTCIRRPGFPGACSSWHLQVICLHPKCWTIYCICHSVPFFLVNERSGRKRPLREAPCTYISHHTTCKFTTTNVQTRPASLIMCSFFSPILPSPLYVCFFLIMVYLKGVLCRNYAPLCLGITNSLLRWHG